MKKLWLAALGILILVTGAGLVIPRKIEKSYSVTVNCPSTAVSRHMLPMDHWQSWWPGTRIGDSSWQAGDLTFTITQVLLNGFQAAAVDQNLAVELQFIPGSSKETNFSIRVTSILPVNPFARLWTWAGGGAQENSSTQILKACSDFFGQPERVYGINIVKGKVAHFSWVSTKETFDHDPATEEIYRLIDALLGYIQQNKAQALGAPILHVHQDGPRAYEMMVALPTDRDLPANGRFQLKNMILGSLLTATVKGGNSSVRKAASELENYVRDYRLVSPAIPFQTLITDRRKEADSTRWISQANYPIFN